MYNLKYNAPKGDFYYQIVNLDNLLEAVQRFEDGSLWLTSRKWESTVENGDLRENVSKKSMNFNLMKHMV